MENKPLHYDGSQSIDGSSVATQSEQFKITDEMRANISGNPYFITEEE